MKRIALCLACGLLLAGCQTIHTSMEKVRAIGDAVIRTTEIVDAAADDVDSVWKDAGLKADEK